MHQDPLHTVAVRQAEEVLLRIIHLRAAHLLQSHRLRDRLLRKLCPHGCGEIQHLRKIRASVNPLKKLISPEGGDAFSLAPRPQLLRIQIRQDRWMLLHRFCKRHR